MSDVSPQGVEVRSFKQPSAAELEHDFSGLPGRAAYKGRVGIVNRSHYEEVLVVRMDPELLAAESLPEAAGKRDIWAQRYWDINRWEHT